MRNPESSNRQKMPDEAAIRNSFQHHLEQDTPDKPWQKVIKHQLNPNTVGALTAIGFATVLTADVLFNGPSDFVVNHPEAATTALTATSAAIGALANKLVREANAKELSQAHRTERIRRRQK